MATYTRNPDDPRAPHVKPFPAVGPPQHFSDAPPTKPPPDDGNPYMWLGGRWVLMSHAADLMREANPAQTALDRIVGRLREYSDDEPRDDHGRWSGGGDSGTATAEHMDGAAFASKMDGFSHGGITTSVANRTDTQGDYARVFVNMHNAGGDNVGQAVVKLAPADSSGTRLATLEAINLQGAYQNQGFGSAFSDHLFSTLREGGVDQVNLQAAGTGGYAWARQGFTWTGDAGSAQQSILSDAVTSGRWGGIAAASPGAAVDFASRVSNGAFSSEAEMAAFGWDRPAPDGSWVGKSVMMGSSWSGSRAP